MVQVSNPEEPHNIHNMFLKFLAYQCNLCSITLIVSLKVEAGIPELAYNSNLVDRIS